MQQLFMPLDTTVKQMMVGDGQVTLGEQVIMKQTNAQGPQII